MVVIEMNISIIGMSERLYKYYKRTGYLPIELHQDLYNSDLKEIQVDYYRVYDYIYNFAFNISVNALRAIYLSIHELKEFKSLKTFDDFVINDDSISCTSISVSEFLCYNQTKLMPCSVGSLPVFEDVSIESADARDYISYTNSQADMLNLHLSGENKLHSKVIKNNNLICLCYYKTKHYLVVDTVNTYPYLLDRQHFLEIVKQYNFSNVDFDAVDEMPHLSKKYVALKEEFCSKPEISYKMGSQELSIVDKATKLAVTTNKNVKGYKAVALYAYYCKNNCQDLSALLELNKISVKDFFVIVKKKYNYMTLNDLIQSNNYEIIYDMKQLNTYAYAFNDTDYNLAVVSISSTEKVLEYINQASKESKYYYSIYCGRLLYLNISYSNCDIYSRLLDYFLYSKSPLQTVVLDKQMKGSITFRYCYNLYVRDLPVTLYSDNCYLMYDEGYYIDDMLIISDCNAYMSTYNMEDYAGLNKLRFYNFSNNKTVAYLGCNFSVEAIGMMLPFLLNFDIWVFNTEHWYSSFADAGEAGKLFEQLINSAIKYDKLVYIRDETDGYFYRHLYYEDYLMNNKINVSCVECYNNFEFVKSKLKEAKNKGYRVANIALPYDGDVEALRNSYEQSHSNDKVLNLLCYAFEEQEVN